MFDLLAQAFQSKGHKPTVALEVHPGQLSRWLDEVWGAGPAATILDPLPGVEVFLGKTDGTTNVVPSLDAPPAGAPSFVGPSGIDPTNAANFTNATGPLVAAPIWHHLIYAYLLENTGAVEIMAEVVRRSVQGETLEIDSNRAVQWLRATEELFFREPPLFSIPSVSSQLRPEARVVRRNAYWRMFGLDLSHAIAPRWANPALGAQPWKVDVGNGVNTSFREKWAELLRQVWLGYENRNNAVGANGTDNAFLRLLCETLRDMMNMRRRGGFLAREEFASVAVTSWFDLTLSDNTPIVLALNCQAASRADRLALIAQRVGMAPAPRARELFELAPLMSVLLRVMEGGAFNSEAAAELLYKPGTELAETMNRIIDLWQSATGERVKDRPVGTIGTAAPAQPVRIPSAQPLTLARPVAAGTGGRS